MGKYFNLNEVKLLGAKERQVKALLESTHATKDPEGALLLAKSLEKRKDVEVKNYFKNRAQNN
jgi:hypothetical protein